MQYYQETRIGRLDDSLAKHYYICVDKGGTEAHQYQSGKDCLGVVLGFEG
jgi:hypothetical protein